MVKCVRIKEDTFILGTLWSNIKVRAFLGGVISDDLIERKIVDIQPMANKGYNPLIPIQMVLDGK